MNAYELRILGLEHPVSFATARWEASPSPRSTISCVPPGQNDSSFSTKADGPTSKAGARSIAELGHPAMALRAIGNEIDSDAVSADARPDEQFFKTDPTVEASTSSAAGAR